MAELETLEEFYKHKFNTAPENLNQDTEHFNVFALEEVQGPGSTSIQYNRRDFFKISMMRGQHIYHYADKTLATNGSTLIFFNPTVPYKYECITEGASGYFCIFKEAFFSEYIRSSLKDLPMFQPGAKPAYLLNPTQDAAISNLFQKMKNEKQSNYAFRFDLIRNYIMEMVHAALKMEPSESLYKQTDANTRITAIFTDLLEQQFPIKSPEKPFSLRSAKDFASLLHVHPNHLNRALRTTTGKTTTEHIAERLLAEAKALLKHTNWNIAEISYSLGFQEPAHFNHFFKKHTRSRPSAFRH